MTGKRKNIDERRSEILSAARAVAMSEGLEQLTGRKVATRAGLSSGLVFFHFESREALLEAVLDTLIEDIFGGLTPPEGAGSAEQRFLTFFQQRLERLKSERRQIELFIDFWVLGLHNASIRKRIRAGLERYRAAIKPVGDELARARANTTGDGLAQLAVSFILGSALQLAMDSGRLDPEELLGSVRGLLFSPTKKA